MLERLICVWSTKQRIAFVYRYESENYNENFKSKNFCKSKSSLQNIINIFLHFSSIYWRNTLKNRPLFEETNCVNGVKQRLIKIQKNNEIVVNIYMYIYINILRVNDANIFTFSLFSREVTLNPLIAAREAGNLTVSTYPTTRTLTKKHTKCPPSCHK